MSLQVELLGDKWTPNVKEAWVGAYGAISEIMLDGADYSQAEIALKPEPSNTVITAFQTKPLESIDVDSNGASGFGDRDADSFSHDSGKATGSD